MVGELWRIVFFPKINDAVALDEFLGAKLHTGYQHFMGHSGRIMIEGAVDKDDAWKVAEWVRHRSPLGEGLRYIIVGYEGLKIIYLSYCDKCKKGEGRHDDHTDLPFAR